MNFHSLITTKATRVTGLNTHTPRSVMEFGTRRAQERAQAMMVRMPLFWAAASALPTAWLR